MDERSRRQTLRKLFQRARSRRLVRHYFFISVVLVSGGLIAGGAVELYFRYIENWDHIGKLQQKIAEDAAFRVEQYVQEIERTMKTVTRGEDFGSQESPASPEWVLAKLLAVVPAITEAAVFDMSRVQHAAASRLRPILPQAESDSPSPEIFAVIDQGRSYFGPVYFRYGSEPYMSIAVPIEPYVNEVAGLLQARVNLKYVWMVISNIDVGQEGYAYLVTRTGDLIAHANLSLVLQQLNMAHFDQVRTAFQSTHTVGPQTGMIAQNLEGERVFSSSVGIPKLDWAVVTEQPVSEIYAPLYASMLRTSGILAVGVGAALLATIYLGRRVVRPIEALRSGVERIGGGDLAARLHLETGDEFQVFSDEFNRMAVKLEEAHSGLEQEVLERTRALTEANQKLLQASTYKSQFLADVNHELRTPISAIISSARLILRKTEGQIDPSQKENLQDLLGAAERLLVLVNGLLDLSRIEAGHTELRLQAVDVAELIDSTTSIVESMLESSRVQLTRDIAPGMAKIYTDREKLRQILLNLLVNAAKFTDQGQIKVSAVQQNGTLKLAVSDTGIGIEEKEQDSIFEEFRQGKSSGNGGHRGTGLGLAISRKLADLLGGRITVVSEVGKGSTFTVLLPCDPRESGSAREKDST